MKKIAFILALCFSGRLPAEAVAALPPLTATAEAPSASFAQASLQDLADFGSSPLRLRTGDLAWLLPSAVGLGVILNNDVELYGRLAKGDARKDWLDHSMPAASALGEGLIELSAAALAAKLGDPRLARTSTVAMQGLIVVAVYAQVFKFAAWSNRPYIDDSAHRFWAFDQDTQGMPSGHSFSAFCAAEVYGAEYGRLIPYSLASVIAYSRVYNQDHWPSDVFAGSVLGIIAGVQARREAARRGDDGVHLGLGDHAGTPLLVAHVAY